VIRLARVCSILTASVLAVLGLIHVYWAARGSAGRSVALPERDGRPIFQPGRASTLAVAAGLSGGALVLLARAEIVRLPVPTPWLRWGAWALAALFAFRALGDFRYVGLFKRVKHTPFARWDTRLFTPLCGLIALGSGLVAAGSPARATLPEAS
jgi:hypothetical protein